MLVEEWGRGIRRLQAATVENFWWLGVRGQLSSNHRKIFSVGVWGSLFQSNFFWGKY